MKIYIASRYSRRAEMEKIADDLKSEGFKIVSTWVYGGEENLSREDIAFLDYNDVKRSDVVLSFTEPRGSFNPAGARHTEFGFGYEMGKDCVLVGDREIVFHWFPTVKQFSTYEEAKKYLHASK